ncbi:MULTISPECIES: 4-oxalomesaconate tautomerase [unclassified Saccharopolyspora]|uniref:4-oxalomesaconate tautomerase n=1 Tax=unclassified Saccharopolyspora TaxID=2646250 RepID=UPI001CD3F1BF|nr:MULTISPECIES: 4-oxalomesaconate tautomerase [unclassified Saccharopolyspora]MCA1187561.1 4-oxalomesaconate tautomerase [Saccharopolyspora sp. 6T]MCA1224900.1 4-oxalomesaconate tautomerase [Saccharopolyspora sp. 6M]MCA1279755.1 4-oxalomesaconate tautomerase [Saccharopolyspora sp. 7B]
MPADAGPAARSHRRGAQTAVPCLFLRGGTSRGPFFDERALPADVPTRDAVLLAALGSPDERQIDGLGGAHPLTSKVGIVRPSERPGVDVEWTFGQVQPGGSTVDTTANCGNMLAAVLPFAVETGMVVPDADRTTARVLTRNTGMVAEITVRTPAGPDGTRHVEYAGDARIDGVPGTAAPVEIGFLDTAGSVAGSLLPTGNTRDTVEVPGLGAVDVTLIDNGQPLVVVQAARLGSTGYEDPAEIDADAELRAKVEALRLVCGRAMGLGDVEAKNYPKMTLVAPPRHGGDLSTRSLIPRVAHRSIGVLAAVTAATACVLEGSVAREVAAEVRGTEPTVSVEHPSGEFSVTLGLDPAEPGRVLRSGLLRTARLLMSGEVLVPAALWNPAAEERSA